MRLTSLESVYRPPSYLELPASVLRAEVLLGTLVTNGPGFRGVGWPDNAPVRASSLVHLCRDNLVVVLQSAAFVWGCDWPVHANLELSTFNRKRYMNEIPKSVRVHEFSIPQADSLLVSGVNVTTPLRTVYDLLYLPEDIFSQGISNDCKKIITEYAITYEKISNKLLSVRRPYRSVACKRLKELF